MFYAAGQAQPARLGARLYLQPDPPDPEMNPDAKTSGTGTYAGISRRESKPTISHQEEVYYR